MASTATISVSGTIVGQAETGSMNFNVTVTNSSSPSLWSFVNASTSQGTATLIAVQSSANYLLLIPPSGNNLPYRLTQTTAEVGIEMSSQGVALLNVIGGANYFIYTTGSSAINHFRLAEL